jgi:cephalosporin-C deacetylase-like acetyl esterase
MREVKLKVAMVFARKTIVLLMRRHDSEKLSVFILTYIDTKELASRREEIVLQSNCNQLVCSREYTRKVYT